MIIPNKLTPIKRKGLLGFGVIALFLLLSCGSQKPLLITVRDLSACQGQDNMGQPQGISKTFFTDDKNIFACGRLETNYPSVAISVGWKHEDKYLGREVLSVSTGYFYSPLEKVTNNFQEGTYELYVVIGKGVVYTTTFNIEHR